MSRFNDWSPDLRQIDRRLRGDPHRDRVGRDRFGITAVAEDQLHYLVFVGDDDPIFGDPGLFVEFQLTLQFMIGIGWG